MKLLLPFFAICSLAEEPYPVPRMDARVELLSAVQHLAAAERRFAGRREARDPYSRALEAWIEPLRGHPAVSRYAQLSARGADYVAWLQLVLRLGPPPQLSAEALPGGLDRPFGGEIAVEEMRLLLVDFAREARFLEFYDGPAARLRADFVKEARDSILSADARRVAENYWGGALEVPFEVIVSPSVEPAFSVVLALPGGGLQAVYGPSATSEGPRFLFPVRLGAVVAEVFLARLMKDAEPHRARERESAALFAPVAGLCAEDWHSCARRHAAFAAGARALALAGQREAAEEWPVKYARLGLPYLEPLMRELERYERERTRYKTFLSFYPELLEALVRRARKGPAPAPFSGGLSALAAERGPAAVILPRGAFRARALAYARALWPQARLLEGEEALKTRLSGLTLAAFGPPSSNAWLKRRWGELGLPFILGEHEASHPPEPGWGQDIRRFAGRPGLASVALNPDDSTRGLLLLTGYDEAAAALALEAPLSAGDFALKGPRGILKIGLYERTRRPWRVR